MAFCLKSGPGGLKCRYETRFDAKVFSKFLDFFWDVITSTILSIVRILMYLASPNGHQLKQMLKTCLFKCSKKRRRIIKQPEGFEFSAENGKPFVSKLKKSFYGAKQARRNSFLTLKSFMITLTFFNSFHGECLFIKRRDEKMFLGNKNSQHKNIENFC